MFSAHSGVVWDVQCFALLKFIIPFVFLISCTLWEMIQHAIIFKGSVFPHIKQTNKHLKVHEPMTWILIG